MSDIATLTRLVAELSGRLDALAARVALRIGTPQVPSPNLVVEAIQSAHGFALGHVVKKVGTSWSLASEGDDGIGVVCRVVDADTVWVCQWGLACLAGATYAEGSVYYLSATPGTPSTTPGTPKRAVFFAVSPTMILVTNPAKDASGGGIDAITGPAVLGKPNAGSGIPDAITATANTALVCTASGLAFAQIATPMIADSAITSGKIAGLAITSEKIAGGAVGPDEMADTAVSPGDYGSATKIAIFTVDQQGRITAAASVEATPAWASVTGKPAYLDSEAAEGTVLQRAVGGATSFATTIVLGKAGVGGSLGGWKVNASTSGTASEWEASGAANALTAKYSGTTVLDIKAGSTQQIVLKNTSGTAGTTIQIDWSGDSPRLQMFRPDVSTTVPMLDINLATAPTGGWTTAKAVTLREIDVCDSGVAKKVMRLESAPY